MLTGSTSALLCALSFAFAAISIRRAVIKGPAVMHGVFISILISVPFYLIIRNSFLQLSRKIIWLYGIVGIWGGIANLFRFLALNLSPASVVTPLLSTTPVFLVALSFLLNRKLEVFNLPVIVGTVAVVIGAILLV